MAITDTRAVKFTNEKVRPLAEKLRALKVEIDAIMIDWFDGMNVLIPNSTAEALDDKRGPEGVSRLTGDDITGLITVASELQTVFAKNGYAARVAKPTVRPLKAE